MSQRDSGSNVDRLQSEAAGEDRVSHGLRDPCTVEFRRDLLCDIIDEQSSRCASVITACDGTESFLTCCVPELKLDALVADLDQTTREFDSDCVC